MHFHTGALIKDVTLANNSWRRQHLATLSSAYGRSPHFSEVYEILEKVFNEPFSHLVQINIALIRAIACYLGVQRRFIVASEIGGTGAKDDRIVSIVQRVGADTYISGKGGENYQDPSKFAAADIQLEVCVYQPIQYPQLHGEFVGGLSILDALFNVGRDAVKLLDYSKIQ
jgi:hypothetical protein